MSAVTSSANMSSGAMVMEATAVTTVILRAATAVTTAILRAAIAATTVILPTEAIDPGRGPTAMAVLGAAGHCRMPEGTNRPGLRKRRGPRGRVWKRGATTKP